MLVIDSVPAFIVVLPEYVLVAENVRTPRPSLIAPTAPEIADDIAKSVYTKKWRRDVVMLEIALTMLFPTLAADESVSFIQQ